LAASTQTWTEAGFTNQLGWVKWYASMLSPEVWEDWPEMSQEKQWAQIRKEVFVNQGWRLTANGLRLMSKLYQSWSSKHNDNRIMTGKLLLGMDRALGAPWGVRDSSMVLFDSQMHFELQMCNGSAQEWLRFHLGG